MTATPVGMRCPECARQTTTVRTAGAAATGPLLTYTLIALNVLVALGGFLSGASTTGGGGVGAGTLIAEGAVSRPAVAGGEWWRIVTAGFIHAGLFHLMFNMLALYILGSMLEPAIGRLRFALVYFVSLLAGSFGALLLTPVAPTVGASGAIFGLMGAAVVLMRNRGLSIMESGLGIWIGLNLLITFTVPGISIGGHIGGLAGGALVAFLFYELGDRLRVSSALTLALVAAVGGVAIAGSIAVSTA